MNRNTVMLMEDAATQMAHKFRAAEEKVAAARGPFTLFGLFKQAKGRWDLVVSASWLKTDFEGTQEIIILLRDHMQIQDWDLIGAVFPLEPSADYVRWITSRYKMEHEAIELAGALINDVPITHAFLITSNPSPASVTAQPVAA